MVLMPCFFFEISRALEPPRNDPDIEGKILDFDTKEPIAGVVVMAMWTKDVFRLTIEPESKFYDYFETITDDFGEFKIKGQGVQIFRKINPPTFKIYKSGYASMNLGDLGKRFLSDSPFGTYIKRTDEGKFIISFKKKTREERKKIIVHQKRTPFYKMGFVPEETYKLHLKEVEREFKALGRTPYWKRNPLELNVKPGGVYPSQEVGVKPIKNK